jgi:hypothetical protein
MPLIPEVLITPPATDPKQNITDNTRLLISPSNAQPEAPSPASIPEQSPLPTMLGNQRRPGVPSTSVQNQKAAQLKAARNLVKRAQQQQKKQIPGKVLNSKPTPPAREGTKFDRSPVESMPEKPDSTTATERLKGFFKSWF